MNLKTKETKIAFSILMANFNNEKYIEDAINSVLNQTFTQWELIIVDDKSTDNSLEKINPFLKFKNIHLIKHQYNLGYGGTLKTAAKKAKNQIIAILDPDDVLHTAALEKIAYMYEIYPKHGFIYSSMWRCDEELKNCKIDNTIRQIDVNDIHSLYNPPISHFKTFKKNIYMKTKGFEVTQKKAVDKDIFYKLSEVTDFKFLNLPLYYYREHETGISQGSANLEAKYFSYIARLKAYRRRKNTNLPNFDYRNLKIFYYYNITFYNVFRFLIKKFLTLRLDLLINYLISIIPVATLKKRLLNFKSKYIDIFG